MNKLKSVLYSQSYKLSFNYMTHRHSRNILNNIYVKVAEIIAASHSTIMFFLPNIDRKINEEIKL